MTFCQIGLSQSNLRSKKIVILSDTIQLDSLMIIPGSFVISSNGQVLTAEDYVVDELNSVLILNKKISDTLSISYRVFPDNFNKSYSHKSQNGFEPDIKGNTNPFTYKLNENSRSVFDTDGLSKSGSISRGISFGNNQDLSVNSNLNLQLSGKIGDKIQVVASVTDDNIPIQPDGNTQQLQDFDQVYIKIFDDKTSLTAGDFWMKKPMGYFMVYNKRGQGASFSTAVRDKLDPTKTIFETKVSAAISKGKFARNVIQGVEGNQGPYRLIGAENEPFIIVLAGTETVYIDGQLLKRGQEFDYVIDYNTSEIIFTPNRLITKDRRIIVEFQYSDKNYARSILENTNTFYKPKSTFFLNAYSEQDSKNQPLQQELSLADKTLLNFVGDSIQNAVNYSIDSVGYDDNLVLYKMIDSLGYDSVFVFSNSVDSAFYKLNFSYVGPGKGNYKQSNFTALGRTFVWVAPDTVGLNIIKQGDYEPVSLLISPKQKQMVSAGGEIRFNKFSKLWFEGSLSKEDPNTFSQLHNEDNIGFGARVGFDGKKKIKTEANDWSIKTKLIVEAVTETFKPIQRFRAVEFERNWNVANKKINGHQLIGEAEIGLYKEKIFSFNYGFNSFLAGTEYTGMIHQSNGNLAYKGWKGNFTASLLDSKGITDSRFIRHQSQLSKTLKFVTIGFRDIHELNTFYGNTQDSLQSNSYQWYDWEVYLENPDTTKNRYQVYYRERYDLLVKNNDLAPAATARQYGLSFDLIRNPKNQLRGKFGYRELKITDTTISSLKPDQTLVSRLEYDLKFAKNAIALSTFYEIGTGLELKREFIYLEVPAGQGIYTWIDYNENGIKELNEFEVAAFTDQATYIRSFTPTNEYVKTYTNQFSQSLNITPAYIWKNKKGIRKILAKFSNQTAYRVDRKTNSESELDRFNPFLSSIADSSLLTLNSSFRNTLFFNRTDAVFGLDYSYQKVEGKSLLTNGFDSRFNRFNQVKLRWNITPVYGIITEAEQGTKGNSSDFLSGRNYSIFYQKINPKFTIQPNAKFRAVFSYKYMLKQNSKEYGNEQAYINDLGTELKYNVVNKGSVIAGFNFIKIIYTGIVSSSLGFEMLEALKPGLNYTWNIGWQRNISKNMQLNLTYNGRKSEETKIIHIGGVQVRAFF